jgi:hypothetical protein
MKNLLLMRRAPSDPEAARLKQQFVCADWWRNTITPFSIQQGRPISSTMRVEKIAAAGKAEAARLS